jgi:hypothetical protein
MSCVRFCKIHFLRSVDRVCPQTEHVENSLWGRLKSLLDVETAAEYYELCDLLQGKY